MMKQICILIAVLFGLQPAVASAGRGGGMRAPASRPAPSRQSGGGFNLNRDARPQTRPAQPNRPQTGSRPNGGNQNGPNRGNGNKNNGNLNNGNKNNGNLNNGNKNNGNLNNGNKNINNNNINRNNTNINVSGNTVIRNPVYVNNSAWGWNRGVVWAPAPYYWGGGFWGAFAIGVTSAAVGAAVYGSIVSNNVTYTSYQVQANSPGATFLQSYGLTQVQCGPPNLVVVYGPQNSVICANPNSTVAAGYYQLDASTLTLTSVSS